MPDHDEPDSESERLFVIRALIDCVREHWTQRFWAPAFQRAFYLMDEHVLIENHGRVGGTIYMIDADSKAEREAYFLRLILEFNDPDGVLDIIEDE